MIKILSATQIQQWDAYTIQNEPIASIDLMERASLVFTNWFLKHCPDEGKPVIIFCGTGNNGGDGLAVARLLLQRFYKVQVYCCKITDTTSQDHNINLQRLQNIRGHQINTLTKEDPFPPIPENAYLVDAIFGTGLNRPVEGYWSDLIDHINSAKAKVIAIDIPSGLFADQHSSGNSIRADLTLSFQTPKLAFFFPENGERVGDWYCEDIQLQPDYLAQVGTSFFYLTEKDIRAKLKPRKKYAHKGNFGHALLIAGSKGMAGAALLAARACLRSGVGLLTIHVPSELCDIMQIAVPEAMLSIDKTQQYISGIASTASFSAVGIGPGLGKHTDTAAFLRSFLLLHRQPLVIDADALNLLAADPDLLNLLPKGSILTPHPKEFERLFGPSENDFERNKKQRERSAQLGIVIVLKGAHTAISSPEGYCYFNSTGNPGMATGGSGDVLTGIITSLLAQGYPPTEAAYLGVWLHGRAGDLAKEKVGETSLLASDIVNGISGALRRILNKE
jgi:ADP-dependent NAD(P)H-hydrate dehydratase / NAD(P)H-hydrate epimerase